MKRFNVHLVVGLLLMALFLFARNLQATGIVDRDDVANKIEPGLRESVIESGEDSYLVYMVAQADLEAADNITNRIEQGQFVYDTLRETAATSQADLIGYLKEQMASGGVSSYESHFIVNVVIVTSNVKVLDSIAERPDVASIAASRTYEIPEPISSQTAGNIEAIEWGVERIGAPDIWADFGATGQGIVVANVDTGVDKTHPAVSNQYRGTATGSDDFNFYDPANICGGGVCDNNGHGTHTMGTMVGDDGGGNQIGVAPGARWIAAKGCESSSCSDSSLLSAAEWILAPCAFGDDPGAASCDPAMRPNVVNNSWGGGGGDSWYQAAVNAWQASGIIPVFSAGNSGPASGSIGSPGDYCNVIGVGATNINDAIASFSSRGPGSFAACTDKPDVSAPGENVRSSVPGGYANYSGTSMAAPHTAGCVALLLSVAPDLTYTDIYDLLTTTAVDLGTPGFDYNFGNGRLDCYAAALNLTPDFWLATDSTTQSVCQLRNPVTSFDIEVGSIAGFSDPVTMSASDGTYLVNPVLPPGNTTLRVDTSGYPGPGVMPVTATGTSTTGSKSLDLNVNVYTGRPLRANLVSPAEGETGVSTVPTFIWSDPGIPAGIQYDLFVLTDPNDKTSTVYRVRGIVGTSHTLEGLNLDPTTTYYWAVRTINSCGRRVSQFGSFTTRAEVCSAPNLAIPDGSAAGTSDSLTFTPSGSITDLDVYINTTHTWVGDLVFTLTHNDTGTAVTLIHRPGVPGSTYGCSGDNIDATITDEGTANAETTCANDPALGGELVGGDPANNTLMTAFDNEVFGGTWTLSVFDLVGADSGTLNEWCLIGATN